MAVDGIDEIIAKSSEDIWKTLLAKLLEFDFVQRKEDRDDRYWCEQNLDNVHLIFCLKWC